MKEASMKRTLAAAALGGLILAGLPVFGSDLKTDTFQVTGSVSAVDDTSITVMKGKERFHIARDKDTKVTGDLKVGAKVTVKYRMSADSVEVKEEKASTTKKK
jgi:hypothetical protein